MKRATKSVESLLDTSGSAFLLDDAFFLAAAIPTGVTKAVRTFADVIARTTIDSAFSAADRAIITGVLQTAYNSSTIAKKMIDDYLSVSGNTIKIDFLAGKFQAFTNSGNIQIDLNYIKTLSYITDKGEAVLHTPLSAIVHELGHALAGHRDNVGTFDYQGDNVKFVNTIFAQLGIATEISYIAQAFTPTHVPGYQYTNGATIDRAATLYEVEDWSVGPNFSSAIFLGLFPSRDLLIGDRRNNTLESGAGDDFLFGGLGNDTLRGGFGKDTAVYMGSALDYDVRQNADSSWSVKHLRGAKDTGEDRLENIEVIQFDKPGGGKQTYDLKKNGLTYQTDFAFVIDTTGSMGSSIGSVKAKATALIDAIFAGGKADARIGIVGFKDTTAGEPSNVILSFTEQETFEARRAAAQSAINGITVGGGGDTPETAYDGLKTALDGHLGQWRAGAGSLKIALFTDAPAKDGALAAQVTALAKSIGVTLSGHSTITTAGAAVDTFTFKSGAAGLSPTGDPSGDPLFPYVSPGEAIERDATTTQVQIFTIFTGPSGTDTEALKSIAAANGGSFLTAPTNDELVNALLRIINGTTNLPPTAINPGAMTVKENAVGGATVGVLSIVDPDAGDTHTLSLLDDAGGRFVLSGKTLRVAPGADLDFEDTPQLQVTVKATDQTGNSFSQTLTVNLQNLAETFTGTAKNDTIRGDAAANVIDGLAGNDRLFGGKGNDRLVGGAGSDVFVLSAGRDTIGDFVTYREATAPVKVGWVNTGVVRPSDKIDVSAYHLTFADFQEDAVQQGTSVVWTIDSLTSLVLENQQKAYFQAADFIF
jgi:Ca2+-binding RTX toxin-like protein